MPQQQNQGQCILVMGIVLMALGVIFWVWFLIGIGIVALKRVGIFVPIVVRLLIKYLKIFFDNFFFTPNI